MNTLINALTDMIVAEGNKNDAREAFRVARPYDEDYDLVRTNFRAADDAYEAASAAVITLIQELMAADTFSDAVEDLGELTQSLTRFAESRGLVQLISEDGNGLAQMSKRWKKAADKMTAFKRINGFRRDFSVSQFEEILAGSSPANVQPGAWEAAVALFNARLEEFNEKTNYSIEPASAMLEVGFDLEDESRRAYDAVTEKFVNVLRGLQDSGRLEGEMAELDSELLSIVRAGLTRVPQPQLQPQTQTVTRSVTVL